MATDVDKPGPNAFEAYGNSVARMTFPGELLKFTKYGEFSAGRENVEVPLGTRLVVLVPTLLIGFVRWDDNKPVDFQMGLLSEGFVPPKRDELGFLEKAKWEQFENGGVKDPWQFSNQIVMIGLEDKNVYTFTTSSKTGIGAVGSISKDYGHHIRQSPGEAPVIELRRSSFRSTKPGVGDVRFPVFKRVDWVVAAPYEAAIAEYMGEDAAASLKPAEATPAKRIVAKPAARAAVKPTTETTATKAAAKATTRRAKGAVRI